MFWLEGRGTLSNGSNKHNRPQWKYSRYMYRYAESKGENTTYRYAITASPVASPVFFEIWNRHKSSIDVSWWFQTNLSTLDSPLTSILTQPGVLPRNSAQPNSPEELWPDGAFFFNFKVHWSTTPANPCDMSKMFGTKTQAIASIWAKMFHCTNTYYHPFLKPRVLYISTHSGATASGAAWCCASCRNCSRSISWWRRSCSACSCSRGKCRMTMKTS